MSRPPAEAMEAWHSAMNDVGELRANAPDERYAKRAARVASWIKANRPEAPSAPVGVEGLVERMRQAPSRLWMADLVGQKISIERMRDILTFALAAEHQGGPQE